MYVYFFHLVLEKFKNEYDSFPWLKEMFQVSKYIFVPQLKNPNIWMEIHIWVSMSKSIKYTSKTIILKIWK